MAGKTKTKAEMTICQTQNGSRNHWSLLQYIENPCCITVCFESGYKLYSLLYGVHRFKTIHTAAFRNSSTLTVHIISHQKYTKTIRTVSACVSQHLFILTLAKELYKQEPQFQRHNTNTLLHNIIYPNRYRLCLF